MSYFFRAGERVTLGAFGPVPFPIWNSRSHTYDYQHGHHPVQIVQAEVLRADESKFTIRYEVAADRSPVVWNFPNGWLPDPCDPLAQYWPQLLRSAAPPPPPNPTSASVSALIRHFLAGVSTRG